MKKFCINLGAFLVMIALSFLTYYVLFLGVTQFKHQHLALGEQKVDRVSEQWLTKEQELLAFLIANGAKHAYLQKNLDLLKQEKLIYQAKLYGANGNVIAEVVDTLQNPALPKKHVFPLYFNGDLSGFLEVSPYLKPAVIDTELENNHRRFYALMVILFLLGSAFALGGGYVYRSLTHKS